MALLSFFKQYVVKVLTCLVLIHSLTDCAHALQVRTAAPEWTGTALVGESFETLSSSDFLGKWLVLVFYPLDFTFVCPTEIVSYSEAAKKELAPINTAVVGISVDSKFTHLAFSKTAREEGGLGGVDIPLVADITKEISRAYNVLDEIPGDDHEGVAMRGTFIVDPNGILRAINVNDEPLGRDVAETVRQVKALQYADANKGQGCPANWQPGADTIVANPSDSKTFFSKWAK
mmetsp:Transcript_307/g.365  ORF Transcript_307/g.365 Transcript_307/m.365 type:complete len:232 (+) Transcript_307:122-817(+)|eukprot:CAMPEP_0184013974 /NCGR_PEP_ID=MMETSP0954-20121128/5346_1 /TAXON_ID=627963 /ORGANISM="Aplanochytrium sp, Strain PBS07" /LENGTH=231 /DNA_ID=CAMNT_0026294293 /DNA_START=150 /DNA_END=845 /DNA_ORIENTATION=-